MKKLLSILVSACMAFALLPVMNAAAETYTIVPTSGGKCSMSSGHSYVINGNYSVSDYSLNLTGGSATLIINGNVTINNNVYTNLDEFRAGLIIVNNATLTLIVNRGCTLTVYGSAAAASASMSGSDQEILGGRAGIRVPYGCRLNIMGGGTVRAYGGNGNFGGGAAGIGGNGGQGYLPAAQANYKDGGAGESAGTVCIFATRVEAYGGSAGIGQTVRVVSTNTNSASAGSGYPGAGIGGGGGAGGSWGGHTPGASLPGGGGGFNGGAAAGMLSSTGGASGGAPGSNGSAGTKNTNATYSGSAGGGGYFETAANSANTQSNRTSTGGALGGGRVTIPSSSGTRYSGQGGAGGSGGTVYADTGSTVIAYNGSYSANSTANASNQTPIYMQLGYTAADIRSSAASIPSGYRTASTLPGYLNNTLRPYKRYAPSGYGLGIGAGAGFTEGGNGGYSSQSSQPGKPVVVPSNGTLSVYGWAAPAFNALAVSGYQVNVYSNANCTSLVKTATIGASVPTASSPCVISALSNGTTYYVKVTSLYSGYAGIASEAVSGTPYTVSISPAAGAYYKGVEVTLSGTGVKENNLTTVYSTDGGKDWNAYSDAVSVTSNTTVQYGVRTDSGAVTSLGSAAYTLFEVTASPESGTYRDQAVMKLGVEPAGANIAATGHELVYSVNDGASWAVCPAAGVRFTSPATVRYGVRRNGTVTEAGSREYQVYGVTASPESGSYYKKVDVTLTGAGVTESGGTLVYSLDGGAKWEVYPLTGLTLTQSAELEYGVREASGEVQKMGSRTYNVCSLPFEFASLTLHNSANGTGADIGGQSAAGLTGSVSAKVSGLKSYTSDAGYIVLAVYSEGGAMERMTLTPIGGRSDDVVSKAIQLPRALTAGDTVRAFVVAGFTDVMPIGAVAQTIGEE